MKNKISRVGIYISTLFFLGFVSLYIYAWIVDPDLYFSNHRYFPLGSTINMTVTKLWGGNILFFNRGAPYTGSAYALVGENNISQKKMDFYGIYFRLIQDSKKNSSWWTLMISLWYPIIIFGILPAVFVAKKLRGTKNLSEPKK